MNWKAATTEELCGVIMDDNSTPGEVQAAGEELFSRIGGPNESGKRAVGQLGELGALNQGRRGTTRPEIVLSNE